jgi:hypothetical protein
VVGSQRDTSFLVVPKKRRKHFHPCKNYNASVLPDVAVFCEKIHKATGSESLPPAQRVWWHFLIAPMSASLLTGWTELGKAEC